MPTPLQVPQGVPCPSVSEVSPVERRLIADLTYTARTIERDERQYQTLSFVFNAEQAAAFRLWWRNDLYYGGAWFSAPATWPTPAGLVVKVRRFISAPNWSYASVGYWRVSIDCEVRGESELPMAPDDGPLPLWLDNYDGISNTLLQDHAQDIPFNASVWAETNDEFNPQLRLNGAGAARGGIGATSHPTFARTDFSGGEHFLEYGYELVMLTQVLRASTDSAEGEPDATECIWSFEEGDGSGLICAFRPAIVGEDPQPSRVQISYFGANSFNEYFEWPADNAMHELRVIVFEHSVQVFIDGDLVGTISDLPESMARNLYEYQSNVAQTYDDEEFFYGLPSDLIGQSAIYGTLAII